MSNLIKYSSLREKTVYLLYAFVLFAFFLYTFTQIDLGLTISRIPGLQNIVRTFQYIGYFNRPLSTTLYICFLIIFHAFYFFFLYLAFKRKLSVKKIWLIILTTAVILVFSYSAFSYDLFNYIFDARIVSHYHQNPYIHKALDYPGDKMLGFMHWTHRTYPYGPVWLALTVPFSFLGFNLFLPTFLLFKILMTAGFLGTLYFIGKILKKIAPGKEVLGLVFFGLNPLIIIECLVSAHLDIVMIFFAVWSLYLLVNKRYTGSVLLLFISAGIKFATGILLPVYLIFLFLQWKKKQISWNYFFIISLLLMIATVILAANRTNFQPWYLIGALFMAVFLSGSYIIIIPGFILSLFALLNYVPFLYLGNWDKPVPQILADLQMTSLILSLAGVVVYFVIKQVSSGGKQQKI